MKKYRFLILSIVFFSSLLGLLIYRNEYNKLRSTFEILNFFSAPVNLKDCLTLNETVVEDYTYKNLFTNSPPMWIRVGEFYIYSAFWQSNKRMNYAKAIGVGPIGGTANFDCHVWFDHQDVLLSTYGKFSYSMLFHNETALAVYEFLCEVDIKGSKGMPYNFVFIQKLPDVRKIFIPIFTNQFAQISSNATNFGICIRPDHIGFSKTELIEFISFHQVIGLSDVIVYENGIHHGILSKLKRLESLKSSVRSVSILPWNFPYDNLYIEAKVLEMDCLSRTAGVLSTVSILEWNQYIIPKQQKFLSDILQMFDERKPMQFKITTQVCCTNMKNDKRSEKSWPLVLRKTHCMKLPDKPVLIFHPTIKGMKSEQLIQPSSGVVNIYENCERAKHVIGYDSSSHKFIIDLMSNKLIKLWKSGILFTRTN